VKEIDLSNQLESIGASLLRQAALKTNDVTGDGTTTATILAHAVAHEGMKAIDAGFNPVCVKKGIDKAVNFAIDKLSEYSRPIKNLADIVNIASISAGNDTNIGIIIAEAIQKVGREGTISLEAGCSSQTSLEITEGMNLDQGFISPHFLLHSDNMEIYQANPFILLTDQKITNLQHELVSILEKVALTGRSLLIVASDFSREALAMLIANRSKGIVDVVAVRAPGFGNTSQQVLEDLAILTGGKLLSKKCGLCLSDASIDFLGSAERIIVSKYYTRIISSVNRQAVNLRCHQIGAQIDLATNAHEKEKLQNRFSKLQNGIAIIKVGASTESEIRYKKLRFEDAINATKAAIDEGILPGGGATLLHLSKKLDRWSSKSCLPDELVGIQIVSKALSAPLDLIAKNAGLTSQIIVEQVKLMDFPMGYDAKNNLMVDMYRSGIIDPAKVTRLALQNSVSTASIILTAECMISSELPR
jgi:chaperonin GroEL